MYYTKTTEAQCVQIIKDFHAKNGDWPRTHDIPYLSRTIQRRFNGMVAFRKKHKLGYNDYTKGTYRSNLTKEFTMYGNKQEQVVFDFLVKKYGRVNIHREYFFRNDNRYRADFCVFLVGDKRVVVDTFHPKNLYSFKGCLNSKVKKYKSFTESPVIFVQTNENISWEQIKVAVAARKTPLAPNQSVMTFTDFRDIIL